MSFDLDNLYELLPAIYRIRDGETGEPLREMFKIIAEQVAVLEEDLTQLYDDQFIETCAEWVVPYIGDLVGYRQLHGKVHGIRSPRAEVANTIAYRRRKGTAAMLEQLARDVSRWHVRVVEYFQNLATTQHMNHVRISNIQSPDLRKWEPLKRISTSFDCLPRTVDVRRIGSGRGRYNIPNVGIFVWRLGAHSLTESEALRLADRRYIFSPLKNNAPLYTRPVTEDEITHLAEPINVPAPISRRVLHHFTDSYYGEGKSIFIKVNGRKVGHKEIAACDLSDKDGDEWAHMPKDKYGIDPVLGRLTLPENEPEDSEVRVTYSYGFSADMGGGEYDRASSLKNSLKSFKKVLKPKTIQSAIEELSNGAGLIDTSGTVEIQDNSRYEEAPRIAVKEEVHLELRAKDGLRPSLVIGDALSHDQMPIFEITMGEGAVVILNGLLVSGGSLVVRDGASNSNAFRRLHLRHCTLVPGLSLGIGGMPQHPDISSITINSSNMFVEIESCIVGGLRVAAGSSVNIKNSIIDATKCHGIAYAAPDENQAGGQIQIENSTVIGKVHAVFLKMASNSIFLSALSDADLWKSPVISERRQEGCIRFSYIPWGSLVPRRYHCQPEMDSDEIRVRPAFSSLRYGDAGYCQLSSRCAAEIRQGADDEAEMGAFHGLFQPQKEINIRVRLDEYLRFGLEAGIFYAS